MKRPAQKEGFLQGDEHFPRWLTASHLMLDVHLSVPSLDKMNMGKTTHGLGIPRDPRRPGLSQT
jgi:hypothetical protein